METSQEPARASLSEQRAVFNHPQIIQIAPISACG
jgi:hypothetical protein